MSQSQLWTGYYRQIFNDRPHIHYFGYLIAFAQGRDDFQQKIEAYARKNKCQLISQLAPLPANLWFQRHGYQTQIFQCAQSLDENTVEFLNQADKIQVTEKESYLIHQTIGISPLPDVFHQEESLINTPYLPAELEGKGFFRHLNAFENPKEGLMYFNENFIYNPTVPRYYAIVDGVKSIVLPRLCEREGRTESLYKGQLAKTMEDKAPLLSQLTVSDYNTSEFVHLLFAQSEPHWFGLWDLNPAIFIRTAHDFEQVHYHFRKFTHLYREQTDKWYFFRFYDPAVLVAYLQHIAHNPERLASFFGVRNGEAVVESFAARVDNQFHVFSLAALPENVEPTAVIYDNELDDFFTQFNKSKLFQQQIKAEIEQEFPEQKFDEKTLHRYFQRSIQLGCKFEAAISHLVKAQCYLNNDEIFEQLVRKSLAEFGEGFELDIAENVYITAKIYKENSDERK